MVDCRRIVSLYISHPRGKTGFRFRNREPHRDDDLYFDG
jgi:hypothetical protein